MKRRPPWKRCAAWFAVILLFQPHPSNLARSQPKPAAGDVEAAGRQASSRPTSFSHLAPTHDSPSAGDSLPQSTVGIPGKIQQLVLSGSQLEAIPWDDPLTPLTVRIVQVYPHGDAWRYDLEYCGFVAGEFDLRRYLRRIDGTSSNDLPAISVRVIATLPADRVLPHRIEPSPPPRMGGYRTWLVVGVVGWVLGLIAIWRWGRGQEEADEQATRPKTLADRLRPLVQEALEGRLPREQQAQLERLLLNYWRRKLNLREMTTQQSFEKLREHPQAGPLLLQLERWLHHPSPSQPVDLNGLLEPYRHVQLDDLDLRDDATSSPSSLVRDGKR